MQRVAEQERAATGPTVELPPEVWELDVVDNDLLTVTLERHATASRWVRCMTDWQGRRTLEDLRWLARHAAAAVACADDTVLTDLVQWLHELLIAREIPATTIGDSLLFLADSVEPNAPLGAAVLRRASTAAAPGAQGAGA